VIIFVRSPDNPFQIKPAIFEKLIRYHAACFPETEKAYPDAFLFFFFFDFHR
jgi:hypothetical protein